MTHCHIRPSHPLSILQGDHPPSNILHARSDIKAPTSFVKHTVLISFIPISNHNLPLLKRAQAEKLTELAIHYPL
jgi:hypothetical protein